MTGGFVLVGPPGTGGTSDTYILRDGSDKFEPYEKRSSDDRVYSQAGCTYRGRLFVIGSAWFEPENRFFRATAMDVAEYPGDIPCEEEQEPAKEAILTYDPAGGTFEGDQGPYVVKVSVGDEVKIPAAPTREGYTFLYWKDADLKYNPGDKYKVEGDHTFTAVWKKKSDDTNKDDGKNKGDDKKSAAPTGDNGSASSAGNNGSAGSTGSATGNNGSVRSTSSAAGNNGNTKSSGPNTGDQSALEQNLVTAAVALALLLALSGIEVRRRRGVSGSGKVR